MFDTAWIADLDAASACVAVRRTQDELREREWTELLLAAHWASLHGPEGAPSDPAPMRGSQRFRPAGGHGTPEVGEFGCAELGLLMGTGFIAASSLVRDAVDLTHRHPRLWAALAEGKARVWKARQVARLVHAAGLTREQAWFVDAATTEYVDTLSWSAFTALVEARIIEADPAAAEQRRLAESLRRFVATGRADEHGLKTLIARAGAGEVIFFVAMCDRIAQILALDGDQDSLDVRRSKSIVGAIVGAIGILANPAAALELLSRHACGQPHPDDPDRSPLPTSAPVDPAAAPARPLDPDKLRPRAVLHLRISEAALHAGSGVACGDHGIGPVTLQAITDLLGHHRVTIRPVLDLRAQVPVDAYEIPAAMREALRLDRPSSVFPWSPQPPPPAARPWTSTTPARTCPPPPAAHPARPGRAISAHSRGSPTGSRPSPTAGSYANPPPGSTCGAPPTATTTASTTTAPTPSAATPTSPHMSSPPPPPLEHRLAELIRQT